MAQHFLTLGKTTRIKLPTIDLKEVEAKILLNIDRVTEYPGSRRGDSGIWHLSDWINHQIEKRVEGKKGKEVF